MHITDIKLNPNNPRLIKDVEYRKAWETTKQVRLRQQHKATGDQDAKEPNNN